MPSIFPPNVDVFNPDPPVANFHTVKATDVATLQDAVLAVQDFLKKTAISGHFVNVETLAADKTLADTDVFLQRLDCGGVNRDVFAPPSANGNHAYFIVNSTATGNYLLTLKNNAGSIKLVVLLPGESAFLLPDGSGGYKIVNKPFSVVVSPTQITANQNDYFPTGAGSANVIRTSSDVSRDITGVGFIAPGDMKLWVHEGSNNLVFKNENVSSVAANRFALVDSADLTVKPNACLLLWNNPTSQRINVIGGGGSSSVVKEKNVLINGGADFFLRPATPTTVVNMTDDAYNAPDCWYSLIQAAGATITQSGNIGKALSSMKITAGGVVNRYGVAQIVEGVESIPYRGLPVTAQVLIKPFNNAGSGSRDYRIAILEWTGTINTVISELVADWTSSVYTTAGFFAPTSKLLVGTAAATIAHNAEVVLSVSGNVSVNCNNLIVFVWVEDVPTHASDYAFFSEFSLHKGIQTQVWEPEPIAQAQLRCERWGEQTSPIVSYIPVAGNKSSQSTVAFRTRKFSNPTVVCTSKSGTLNKIGEYDPSGVLVTDWNEGLSDINTYGFFYFANGAGLAAGNTLRFSAKAFCEL